MLDNVVRSERISALHAYRQPVLSSDAFIATYDIYHMCSMSDDGGTSARGERDVPLVPHPQQQSLLFQVPIELRQQILEHYARDYYYSVSGPGRWNPPRSYEPPNFDIPTAAAGGGSVFLQPSVRPAAPPTLLHICRRLTAEAWSLMYPEAIIRFSRTKLVAGGIRVDLFMPTATGDHHRESTLRREDVLAVRTLVIELDPVVGPEFATYLRRIFGGVEHQDGSPDGGGDGRSSAVRFLELHVSSTFTEYGGRRPRLAGIPRPNTPEVLPPEVVPAIFGPFLAGVRRLFPRARTFDLAGECDATLKALVHAELGDGRGGSAIKVNVVDGGRDFTRRRGMMMHVDSNYDSD